jgi:hypothetical protein
MKIVLPINTNHNFNIILRSYPVGLVKMELTNEVTGIAEETNCIHLTENGLTNVNFDFAFMENDKFTIKISDDNGVIYRDKIQATSQDTQTFQSSKDLYYYE